MAVSNCYSISIYPIYPRRQLPRLSLSQQLIITSAPLENDAWLYLVLLRKVASILDPPNCGYVDTVQPGQLVCSWLLAYGQLSCIKSSPIHLAANPLRSPGPFFSSLERKTAPFLFSE